MIYLVEDDKSIIRGFEIFFKSAEMDFKSFEKASDFLSEYQHGQQDILVLDLNLPVMSGTELLKELSDKNIKIPTIVVTAFDDNTNRETCKQYGVKAYLRKPVDGEALIDIIKYHQPELIRKN